MKSSLGLLQSTGKQGLRGWITRAVSVVVFAVALVAIDRATQSMTPGQLLAALAQIAPGRLILAAVFAIASYLAIAGYDWAALRYLGIRLPVRPVVLAGVCAGVIANCAGAAVVSGGSVRYQVYVRFGLGSVDVVRIAALGACAFALGSVVVAAGAIFIRPLFVSQVFSLSSILLALSAVLILALYTVALIVMGSHRQAWVSIGPIRFRLPTLSVALLQIAAAVVELGCAAGCLYLLLPQSGLPFFGLLAVYTIGFALGLLSHVPGGIGVLDGVLLVALGGSVPGESLAAAILTFRVFYYVVPLVGALAALSRFQMSTSRRREPIESSG